MRALFGGPASRARAPHAREVDVRRKLGQASGSAGSCVVTRSEEALAKVRAQKPKLAHLITMAAPSGVVGQLEMFAPESNEPERKDS